MLFRQKLEFNAIAILTDSKYFMQIIVNKSQ